MNPYECYSRSEMSQMAKELFKDERKITKLTGWFLIKEIIQKYQSQYSILSKELRSAKLLEHIVQELPISLGDHNVFAGTQRDAFARSYALINPTFEVESFSGYCDPNGVFNDMDVDEEFTEERIRSLKEFNEHSEYVKALNGAYKDVGHYTKEALFFIEQVTGHVIPDFREVLKLGINEYLQKIEGNSETHEAMKIAVSCAGVLARRYAALAETMIDEVSPKRKKQLQLMAFTLKKISTDRAESLYEAIQLFILLWQIMCIEQAPNPFAFSVGNADRIFEPFRAMENLSRENTMALFEHLLVFFNVGDRSWAISQNIIIGGKASTGEDLTNTCSYALLDAYYDMNLPQPILSVKLHRNTPDELYRELGKFFFTPGCLTPSLFNDDSMFKVLSKSGVKACDLGDYSIAGCQEPLIMGKDNGNTTNSWLNLAKILEVTLNNGHSILTNTPIGTMIAGKDTEALLKDIEDSFYKNADFFIDKMVESANKASAAISHLPVPFLSAFMGGVETGYDMRDTAHQGTLYNGSGCLIHGLSVVADSFMAIKKMLEERPQDIENLIPALKLNFEGYEELHQYLKSCPKFGNNIAEVDDFAASICDRISDMVASRKNYLGNPFRPDWSSPSTHLLYGYWVGATPDGRLAREMLGYGVDPLYGEAGQGLSFRMLSNMKLPFEKMAGGYASHFGINPNYFTASSYEEKGLNFKERVINPLFFNPLNHDVAPFYLYVNVTTPEILRKVLENPKKYAPSGVYIMRIHGTFVNFLDLSPAIQQDIIKRLDLKSTSI